MSESRATVGASGADGFTVGGTPIQTWLLGRWVLALYAVIVLPLVAAQYWRMTPLALPGYLIMTAGTIVGRAIAPNYEIWVYWGPFLVGSYALSVIVAAVGRGVRRRV